MEFFAVKMVCDNKEVVNPMNTEEVFTCEDLVHDWKICRKEVSMQTVKGMQNTSSCWDLRKLAHRCYWQDEDDFLDYLIDH